MRVTVAELIDLGWWREFTDQEGIDPWAVKTGKVDGNTLLTLSENFVRARHGLVTVADAIPVEQLMIPSRLEDFLTQLEWQMACAAPLGPVAVEDVVREMCGCYYQEIGSLKVEENPETLEITVLLAHRDTHTEHTMLNTARKVRNPGICSSKWEHNLEWIKGRQDRLPPAFRGLPHNANEEETKYIQKMLRDKTGYRVSYGDVWVHVEKTHDMYFGRQQGQLQARGGEKGFLRFGYLSRQGEIAMRKYINLAGLKEDDDAIRYLEAQPGVHTPRAAEEVLPTDAPS